ncbi:GtrA family protein [Acidisoma cladoniae]|jgi:putative flippase GtrA|uniref:GtrA family protein n=1 Tax=Acidisoma cladoniae TaxID=3040935 RepID=UPI00254FB569|nr:GtrA family protein [Acidisoma sp. PAMC 29798]
MSEPVTRFATKNPLATPSVSPAQALIAKHGPMAMQFFRFGVVGTSGFVMDTAFIYSTHHWLGLIGAGILSFFVVATINWFINRIWTFKGLGAGPLHHQWLRFLAANGVGFVLNRGIYIALIMTVPLCVAYPVLAVAAGSIAGLGVNFNLSRRLVFR